MKIALVLTGLPRKVENGYNRCWKNVIENHKPDIYICCWKDEEWEKVSEIYPTPKKLIIEKPFSFKKYTLGLKCYDEKSKPYEKYGVAGYQNVFPMMWCWQKIVKTIELNYDLIILSRFDIESNNLKNLKNLDPTKINFSKGQWPDSGMPSDSLIVLNQANFKLLFTNIFNNLLENLNETNVLYWQEKMFLDIIKKKGLETLITKNEELNHSLIRGRHGYKNLL